MMTIDQVVPELAAMGIHVTAPVIPDRTLEADTNCVNGDLYPSWNELAALRDAFGLTAVSATQNYNNLPTLGTTEQFQASCGSLNDLIAHGHHRAWGLLAYPNNEFSPDVQANVVQNCFAFGRTYVTVHGSQLTNDQATLTAPWLQVTVNIGGGLCNAADQTCYQGTGSRYASPEVVASLVNVASGHWTALQFYSFVTGTGSTGALQWDCTSDDWHLHWTSRFEVYCWNDFVQAASQVPSSVVVTDPATVAEAWGRVPQPLVTIDSVDPQVLSLSTPSSTITWHAAENGQYSVLVGGTNCDTGTTIETGTYFVSPDTQQVTVPASALSLGSNTVRLCVSNDAGHVGSTTTTLTVRATLPTVSSIVPALGPTAGGTVITVNGDNYTSDATVTVGGRSASGVVVNSPTSITARTPAGPSQGPADVVVIERAGRSVQSSADDFLYEDPPSVTDVTPSYGPVLSTTRVTMTGTNFYPDVRVSIGGRQLTDVAVNSPTSISATLPAAPNGRPASAHVIVSDAGGTSPTSTSDIFNWTAGISSAVALTSSATSTVVGQTITFTASVSPQSATGRVTFYDAGSAIGSAALSSGRARLSTNVFKAGTHSVSAGYAGDSLDWGSASTAQTQNVDRAPTTVSVSSSSDPSTFGDAVTFTASVVPPNATGTMHFRDGSTGLGDATLSAGSAWIHVSGLNGGSHDITAVYDGDADHLDASSSVTQTVNQAATSIVVASSANPVDAGQIVTFTASVAPADATGSIFFYDGTTAVGSETVNGGIASLSTSALAPGEHTISATYAGYGGDTNYASSSSSPIEQVVDGVSRVLPAALGQGAVKFPIKISGAGFEPNMTLTVSGQGVGLSSASVVDSRTISALATVGGAAATGARDVVVSNPNSTSFVCTACLVIDAHPNATSLSPNALQTGATGIPITISGTGFQPGMAKVFVKTGITVSSVAFVSETELSATITVGTSAVPGQYNVKVTNPDGGSSTCSLCFTATQGPVISGINPGNVSRNHTYSLVVAGRYFAQGLGLKGPAGVSFSNVSVSGDGKSITATMKISASAPTGSSLKVLVLNPASVGYGRATCSCLAIT